ncbi:hypothetical protein L1S35_12925 [Flavobacterium sp. AS60]|uniref:hypothetical protein n=1 Tax=Flavobacterium anseongense TaxID=2910677 RepID=UPI001F3A4348|nr:hypothetical protein [Flavobacterium sp. AS60]MCF6130581.1 hypothetical protein [Flavobacterium sp. AS60]
MKILKFIGSLFLFLLPFVGVVFLFGHSPYTEGNSLSTFAILNFVYAIISVGLLLLLVNKNLPKQLLLGYVLLYLLGAVIAGVLGLGEPDFSVNMLQHTEREHYRYIILTLAALLFAAGFILIIKNRWDKFANWNKLIVLLFIAAVAEFLWEFNMNYHYAENLQLWVNEGKNAADFEAHYQLPGLPIGGVGRIIEYTLIIWLGLILAKSYLMKKWSFVLLTIYCLLGVYTGIRVYIYGFDFPDNIKFLLFFFIPAGPILALYWMSVALLTKSTRIET